MAVTGWLPGAGCPEQLVLSRAVLGRHPWDRSRDQPAAPRRGGPRNTAEPFRGLSVGDVVAVGEVALAVARPAGWTPVCGDLHKVRTDGHGTCPLPAPTPDAQPGTVRPPSQGGHGNGTRD